MVRKLKSGNILVISLFVSILLLLMVLVYVFITYSTLICDIFALKTDLFYMSQNLLLALDYEDLSLNKYSVNNDLFKGKLDSLLKLNYSSLQSNFKSITIKELYIIDNIDKASIHTDNRYKAPVIHLNIDVVYVFFITKTEKVFNIHEDIKLDSLTVGDIFE